MKRQEAFDLISTERDKQDVKWGEQRQHPNEIWNLILGEEVGEVNEAVLDLIFNNGTVTALRDELVQVAAVAICWLETFNKE